MSNHNFKPYAILTANSYQNENKNRIDTGKRRGIINYIRYTHLNTIENCHLTFY